MEILQHPSCDLDETSQAGIWESSPFVTVSSCIEYIQDKGIASDGRESEEICLCLSLLSTVVFLVC